MKNLRKDGLVVNLNLKIKDSYFISISVPQTGGYGFTPKIYSYEYEERVSAQHNQGFPLIYYGLRTNPWLLNVGEYDLWSLTSTSQIYENILWLNKNQ